MSRILNVLKNIKWSEVSSSVIARYVLGIISIINILLDKLGVLPIQVSDSTVYSVCSIVFALIMICVNTYKNNSTSKEAMIADKVMLILKATENTAAEGSALQQIETVLTQVQNEIIASQNEAFEKEAEAEETPEDTTSDKTE